MDRQAWRDFFITVFFLGVAFIIALLSTVAAEGHAARLSAVLAALSLLMAAIGALYIVPRLARRVQLEFLRFAVRTSVTVEGVLFVVLLVVIGFAAWNTGNNLLYLVLSALIAFLVVANFIARISLADVSVQLRFPDHIFAGEPSTLTVTITNHKRFMPSFSLMVEALSEGREKSADASKRREAKVRSSSADSASYGESGLEKLAHFVLIPSHSSARQRIEHTFERRGRYPITAFRISTKFPTGFFKKWRKVGAAGEILVYPKPRPLDDFYHTLPMLAGQVSSHSRGSGDDLYAMRRYHPSDHIRHIDWKATARSLELMVREHIREDERRLTIVLDTSRPGSSELTARPSSTERGEAHGRAQDFEERFERAVVMAASLANHFMLERADVELITPDEAHNVPSGSGFDHLYKILRSLATLHPRPRPAEETDAERRRTLLSRLVGHGGREGTSDRDSPPEKNRLRRLLEDVPVLANERRFKVLITSVAKGTIPANVWRSTHVVFMEDL